MTTEKKLRDALQTSEYALWVCIEHNALHHGETHNTVLMAKEAWQKVLQALATTEPVMANGLTEAETDASASVIGLSQSRDSLNKLVDIMRWVDAYAYDYAKEGKFAKSRQQVEWSIIHELNKISPTGKQSLQVEPAVNQQLTTEPVDERVAFSDEAKDAKRYRWLADSNNYYEAINLISDGSLTEDALGKAIDAAMAKGVKG